MLTVREVAARLRVSAAMVYSLVAQGRLSCHRVGTGGKRGSLRFTEEHIRQYLESCEVRAATTPKAPPPAKRPAKLKHLVLD